MSKNDGGPAFPVPGLSGLPNDNFVLPEGGMSVRMYCAIKVCAALMTTTSADHDFIKLDYRRDLGGPTAAERIATISFAMADALIAAEQEAS